MANQEEFDKKLQGILNEGFPAAEAGDLNAEAVTANEIYQSFLVGEFSPSQAIYLTAAVMTGNPGIAPRA